MSWKDLFFLFTEYQIRTYCYNCYKGRSIWIKKGISRKEHMKTYNEPCSCGFIDWA